MSGQLPVELLVGAVRVRLVIILFTVCNQSHIGSSIDINVESFLAADIIISILKELRLLQL